MNNKHVKFIIIDIISLFAFFTLMLGAAILSYVVGQLLSIFIPSPVRVPEKAWYFILGASVLAIINRLEKLCYIISCAIRNKKYLKKMKEIKSVSPGSIPYFKAMSEIEYCYVMALMSYCPQIDTGSGKIVAKYYHFSERYDTEVRTYRAIFHRQPLVAEGFNDWISSIVLLLRENNIPAVKSALKQQLSPSISDFLNSISAFPVIEASFWSDFDLAVKRCENNFGKEC